MTTDVRHWPDDDEERTACGEPLDSVHEVELESNLQRVSCDRCLKALEEEEVIEEEEVEAEGRDWSRKNVAGALVLLALACYVAMMALCGATVAVNNALLAPLGITYYQSVRACTDPDYSD
jgi:hypothetical protein